jgi:glucose-1-phosphate cytidylyltransferase
MHVSDDCSVHAFQEKPEGDGGWVNGGFFVLEPKVFDYLGGDDCIWEREPLEGLSRDCELVAYRHGGFWMPMDTLRDKMALEQMWADGSAPWKLW